MTDIMALIKTVLERDCHVDAYFENLPSGGVEDDSYIRFQRISASEYFNMGGRSNLHKDRIQITCVGRTRTALDALILLMETSLYGNDSDFGLAYPLDTSREVNDPMYTYMKDFYFFYS